MFGKSIFESIFEEVLNEVISEVLGEVDAFIYNNTTDAKHGEKEFVICKACGGASLLVGSISSNSVFGTTITKFYRCEDCGATTTITTSENSCGRTNEANEEKADESKCRANFLKEKDFEGMSEADVILILVNEYSWPYREAVDFVRFILFKA